MHWALKRFMASVVDRSVVVFTYLKVASNSSDVHLDSGHYCWQLEAAKRERGLIFLYVRRKEGGTEWWLLVIKHVTLNHAYCSYHVSCVTPIIIRRSSWRCCGRRTRWCCSKAAAGPLQSVCPGDSSVRSRGTTSSWRDLPWSPRVSHQEVCKGGSGRGW